MPAELGLVVEDATESFCGAVVGFEAGAVVLEDRFGKRRLFPLEPAAFLLDGEPVTLRRPVPGASASGAPAQRGSLAGEDASRRRGSLAGEDASRRRGSLAGEDVSRRRRTASGSTAVPGARARVARASRIWVEGVHDAALVERIWGDDLRIEGVVVEPLDGIDDLAPAVDAFRPGPTRRIGVLVDHLVAGSKESRIVAAVTSPYVLVTGHPYIDIWQAVKPARLGIARWPTIAPGRSWKEGVCTALGVAEPADMWRHILSRVDSYRDVETPLITAIERLIDFVTEPAE